MESKRPYDAVLFDLDGTLIDTTPLILASFRFVEQEHRGPRRLERDWLEGLGTALRDQLREYVFHQGLWLGAEEAETDRMLATYRRFNRAQHDRLAQPFAGVEALLQELQRRRYELAVVTSKSRDMARRGLELFGLSRYFSAFVGLEDTALHKPNPDPVLLGASRLGVEPARALYVGDAPADLGAAQAAGMGFGAAQWGGLDLLHSLDGATARLQRPADLLAVLP